MITHINTNSGIRAIYSDVMPWSVKFSKHVRHPLILRSNEAHLFVCLTNSARVPGLH